MDDSKLLQQSNLAQGPYVATRGGVKPATFHTEGTDHQCSL